MFRLGKQSLLGELIALRPAGGSGSARAVSSCRQPGGAAFGGARRPAAIRRLCD
jgi:hypothetical protein